MAFIGTNIVARRSYASPPTGLSGFLDDLWSGVKGGVSGAVTYYGQAQRDAGAASVANATAAAAAAQAMRPQPSLITPTTVAIGAVGVVGLVLLLRKKG